MCNFLNSMGANIEGINTSKLIINSVKHLHSTNYTIISDRIEAGTFLILGALHSGIKLRNACPEHLNSLITYLKKIGCAIKQENDILLLHPNKLKSFNIETNPYPSLLS